jgi:NAD(P)-dependent dehydrogenase (short-subunit alcohol dehydrogenase family)
VSSQSTESKVVLLTGAARGIGLASAETFMSHGFRVALSDRDFDEATKAVSRFEAGANAVALSMDVTSTEDVDRCVAEAVSHFGRLDALINVAGAVSKPSPAEEEPDSEWTKHLETHLMGTVRCSRAAYTHLAVSPLGSIVNVSSIAAHIAIRLRMPYAAAKAGIEGLTRSLSVEWARAGIRVNAVAPGYIRTERLEAGFSAGTLDEKVLSANVPLGRLGTAQDIADLIYFLASERAGYITGQTIVIDGGATIDSGH